MENNFKYEDYKFFRCIFLGESKKYIKAKDFNGKRYKIVRNESTKNFKKGFDDIFYAVLKEEGFFKTNVLYPISYEEYLNLKEKAEQ